MKGAQGPAAQLLHPILDTYRGSALAVIGCHARGLERPSCELDVLVVTNDRRPNSTVRIGDVFLDLFFVSEKEVLMPSNPEHSVSLAHAKTVRDTSLILSTSLASNAAVLANSTMRSSGQRLTSALKSLGRVEGALSKGSAIDADYWLLSAAYDCAYTLLYSREVPPSPSHLLSQLKDLSRTAPKSFESFTMSAGLENSSRMSCRSRLDGVAVLYDVLGGGHEGGKAIRPMWSATRLKSVSSKARELNQRIEHAECYSYLGTEMLNALGQLAAREGRATKTGMSPSALATGKNRLLGDRLIRELGLVRERDSLKEALELVKVQVSRLARKT
ncbi:MAG: hypothetical protein ABSB26_05450 [Nitrososphaerales archaeon]|jgi:hypothetical protein